MRDYLHATPPDEYFAAANALIEKWDGDSYNGLAKGAGISVERLLALTSSACAGAKPATGRFPLVVYSGGWYNRSPDNIVLAEYLASHGYVVVAVPLFGSGLWTGILTSSPDALETQARDLETAIGTFAEKAYVDRMHVATIGYSSGGLVALLVAGRHPLVDAVVGLDPSYSGEPDKVLTTPTFSPTRFAKPLLTLRSGNEMFTGRDRSKLIDTLTAADRFTADVGRGSHGDFGDDVVIEVALNLKRPGEPRTAAEGIAAYRAVLPAVRLFLTGTLRQDATALATLAKPTELLRMKVLRAAPGR